MSLRRYKPKTRDANFTLVKIRFIFCGEDVEKHTLLVFFQVIFNSSIKNTSKVYSSHVFTKGTPFSRHSHEEIK